MYLATQDEVITERHQQTQDRCSKMIKEYDSLPFWRRMLPASNERVLIAIRREWEAFTSWHNARICRMRALDRIHNDY